jgi:hypothetical protein
LIASVDVDETSDEVVQGTRLCHGLRGHLQADGRVVLQILLEQTDERSKLPPHR